MNAALSLAFFEAVSTGGSVSGASEDDPLARLYRRACALGIVSAGDFLAIRDLLELSGYAESNPLALHALLLAMFKTLSDGSLCLNLRHESLNLFLAGIAGEDASSLAGEIAANLGAWSQLIGQGGQGGEFKPLLRVASAESDLLYFQRYYLYEQRLKQQLALRLSEEQCVERHSSEQIKAVLNEVLEERCVRTHENKNLVCEAMQKVALCLPLFKDFVIVSGGPGSGKTTIVVGILRCLARLGYDPKSIRLAAPTGRAAYRLTESIRTALSSIEHPGPEDEALNTLEARTLHRLLEYQPSRHRFTYSARNPLPAEVLIVDEASMVDVCMMARLLESIPITAKVILIGDRDQLPSVDAGAVLADLIPGLDNVLYSADMAQKLEHLVGAKLQPSEQNAVLRDRIVMLDVSKRMNESLLEVVAEIKSGACAKLLARAGVIAVGKPAFLPALPAASKKKVDEFAAAIAWPVPLDGKADCKNGTGYAWIDLDAPGAEPWRYILSSWASHQYLTPNRLRPDSYLKMIQEAGKRSFFKEADVLDRSDVNLFLTHIFDCIRQAQILSLIRNGRYGCVGINRRLCEVLKPYFDEWAREEAFTGMPILITRNDYALNLFNGDVGVILKSGGVLRAVFPRVKPGADARATAGFAAYSLDTLPPWEPAFAVTVHKSQGSEYEQVLLVVPPENDAADPNSEADPAANRLQSREILYTGLTRAKHLAILCGSTQTIQAAVARVTQRQSGMSLW